MTQNTEKIQYDNDQLLMQLGWLLERVLVKDGQVELPGYTLSEPDMIESLNELKRVVAAQDA